MKQLVRAWNWLNTDSPPIPSPPMKRGHKIATAIAAVIAAAILIWAYKPTYCRDYKVEDFCNRRSLDYPLCIPKAQQTVRDQKAWCWKFSD